MQEFKVLPSAKGAKAPSKLDKASDDAGVLQLKQDLAGKSVDEQEETLKPPKPVMMSQAPVQYSPDASVQRSEEGATQASDVHRAAKQGFKAPATTMPHMSAIQRSFGKYDVSGVKAHVGGEAAAASQAMGARAYTSGERVGFKGSPDLHTAAHEAAHVVQQRSGVNLPGGVGSTGDSYERHADAVASRVVQGKSAEDLLDHQVSGSSESLEAVQRKFAVTAGQSTKFEIGMEIPIWGPIKAEFKVGGGYEVSKEIGGKTKTTVEASLYGGVKVDFIIISFTLGIEGAVKFEVEDTKNPLTAIKKGIKEIVHWHMAKDFAPKMAQKQAEIESAFDKTRSKCSTQLSKLGKAIKEGDWRKQSKGTSWYEIWKSSTPYDGTVGPIKDLDKSVTKIFDKYDATFDSSKMIDLDKLKEMFDQLAATSDQKAATRRYNRLKNYVLNTLSKGKNDVVNQMAGITTAANDPSVGFQASISIVAGAKVQATKDISVEAQGKWTWSIEDALGAQKPGGKAWEHEVKKAFLLTLKATFPKIEAQIQAQWKEGTFELTVAAFGVWEYFNTDKAAQSESIQSLAQAVRSSGLKTPSGKDAGLVRKTVDCLIDIMKKDAAQIPKSKFTGKGKGGVEIKLKWDKGKLAEGAIKFILVEFELSAEKVFGGLVSGKVETGSFLELKWS